MWEFPKSCILKGMNASRLENAFFVALLAIALVLSWLVLQPYLAALVLAGALAIVFRPVYRGLKKILRYETLASLGAVGVVIVIVFIPLVFFGIQIFNEARGLYASILANGGFDLGAVITNSLRTGFPNMHVADISLNVGDLARQGLSWVIQNVGSLFSGVAQALLLTFLSLFGLFYFLRDGDRLKQWTLGLIPLAPEYAEEILRETERMLGSVIKGTLVVVILQGVAAGLGFFIFGVPNPIFWGATTVLVSLIPIVGTWIAVLPAIAYLFLSGHGAAALGLAVWSLIFVNLIYNVVSPQLMHRGANLHPYLILLSVLGGIGMFGPVGFIIGPFVVAFLFSLLSIYPKFILPGRGGKGE